MKLGTKTKMLSRVLSFWITIQTSFIPFAGGVSVAMASEQDSSALVASFPLERSFCLQSEKIHACTRYYDYYDVKGDLVSSGLEDAKQKLEEQFVSLDGEIIDTQTTGRRVVTETRGNILLPENNTSEKNAVSTKVTEEKSSVEEKDTGAQINTTSGADENKGQNSDPERKLQCPRGYVLDAIYDACCPTTDGTTAVGKYDPYTGKCGNPKDSEESETVFTCPRGYVVDEKYDKCCPTDDDGKAIGKYDPTTDKCGEANPEEKKEEHTCDAGYTLDTVYKKCCPNSDEANIHSKYDPFSDSCKEVSEDPVETMTCDRGYVLDEKYDACCPTGDDGKALGKYDPNKKMCLPDTEEENPTDPQPTVTCPRGYILDEKYDACCPTGDDGKAIGKYNPETDKCGEVKANDVVNTVTCGDNNYLVESVGKCCPINSTYDVNKGTCTNVVENEEDDNGNKNAWTTALGALGGIIGGKVLGRKGEKPTDDGSKESAARRAQGLPFIYKIGISEGDNTETPVFETDKNGAIPEASIYDGQLIFLVDLGSNTDKVSRMEYSFVVKQDGQEMSWYARDNLPNKTWKKVVDRNDLNALLTQLARQSNQGNNKTEYFIYIWIYPKQNDNKNVSSAAKPYQIRVNLRSTMNSLGDGETCADNRDKCKFTVVSDAGAVQAVYSDFIGKIVSDKPTYNETDHTCTVEVENASGILETTSRTDLKETNDVAFGGKNIVVTIENTPKEACDKNILSKGKNLLSKSAKIVDDSTGKNVYTNIKFEDGALSVQREDGYWDNSASSRSAAQSGQESLISTQVIFCPEGSDTCGPESAFNLITYRNENGEYVNDNPDQATRNAVAWNATTTEEYRDPDDVAAVYQTFENGNAHIYYITHDGERVDLSGNQGIVRPDPNGIGSSWVVSNTSNGVTTKTVALMKYEQTAFGQYIKVGEVGTNVLHTGKEVVTKMLEVGNLASDNNGTAKEKRHSEETKIPKK